MAMFFMTYEFMGNCACLTVTKCCARFFYLLPSNTIVTTHSSHSDRNIQLCLQRVAIHSTVMKPFNFFIELPKKPESGMRQHKYSPQQKPERHTGLKFLQSRTILDLIC